MSKTVLCFVELRVHPLHVLLYRIEVQPGQLMRWYQGPLRHMLRNVGSRTFRNVIVEIKNSSTGA